MIAVKLIDLATNHEVTLAEDRAQTVGKEVDRVAGPFWVRLVWLFFGSFLRNRYIGLFDKLAADIRIEIDNNGNKNIYEVYGRSILVNVAKRPMQFYMGILLEEWLQLQP